MKILFFGRGTIATLYGWALEKAGNQVEFYVRPGRAAAYGSVVDLEIRDGRADRSGRPVNEKWPIVLREELDAGHDYDLIVLSVNHDQLAEATAFLSSRVGDATVLVFNNVWIDPVVAVSALPGEQVVWGFPGGGGGFAGPTLRGGILKTVFMGFCGEANRTGRYRAVRALFQGAGFAVFEHRDFRSWLWFHFILDAGFLTPMMKAGGFAGFVRSRAAAEESILLIREMIPLMTAKGGTPGLGAAIVSRLPAGLLGFVLRKVLGGNNLAGFLMAQIEDSGRLSRESAGLYARDVLADGRRLGVPLPRLAALEPVFA
jgi:2-dehydropantoate 2-reductase